MNKKEIAEQGYLITHHLRDVDRYVSNLTPGSIKVRVYALLRSNRKYASVTAFAGKQAWSPEVQTCIENIMHQFCPSSIQFGRFTRKPMVQVDARMARAYHVVPELAEQLCRNLVKYLQTLRG